MYGGNIVNEGNPNQFKADDFKNSYQNEEATGKKQFVILWLHAFSYSYKNIKVETDIPSWAKPNYRMNNDVEEQNNEEEKGPARNIV